VRLKKGDKRDVTLDLALVERRGHIFLLQRDASERRLAGFWELPLRNMLPASVCAELEPLAEFRHQIVNDRMRVALWHSATGKSRPADFPAGKWIAIGAVHGIPLTTVTKKALALQRRLRPAYG